MNRLAPHGGCNRRSCKECFPYYNPPTVTFTLAEVATALQILGKFPPNERLLNPEARAVLLKVRIQMAKIEEADGNGTLRVV